MKQKDFININGNTYPVIVAVTQKEHETGLMFKAWPPPNMCFPYKDAKVRKFWMKNTISPLDIVFCREGKIIAVCQGVPLSFKMIGPEEPADLVLEFPKGFVEKNSISVGDNVNMLYSDFTEARIKTSAAKYELPV